MKAQILISLYILAAILYGCWVFGTDKELNYKLKDLGNSIRDFDNHTTEIIIFLILFLVIGVICLFWPVWLVEGVIRATINLFGGSKQ